MNKRKAKKKYKKLYLDKLASSPIVIDVTGGHLQFSRNREIILICGEYHQKVTVFANIDRVGVVDLNVRNPYNASTRLLELEGDISGYKIENI